MTARNDTFLSIGEAAEKLRVSISTLRRWDQSGAITAVRTLGGQRRYRAHDLENFINGVRTHHRYSLSLMDAFKPQYLLYTIVSTIITAQLLYLALLYTPLKAMFSGQQSIAVPFSRALIHQALSTGTYAYRKVFDATTTTAEQGSYLLTTTFLSALKTFPQAIIPSDETQLASARDTLREVWYRRNYNQAQNPSFEPFIALRLGFDRWGRAFYPPQAQGLSGAIATGRLPQEKVLAQVSVPTGQILGEQTSSAEEFLTALVAGALRVLELPLALLGK